MTEFDVSSLIGTTVVDPSGDPIGTVAQVYLDDGTGRPQWVTVRTDPAGPRETFVPLAAARSDGGRLVVDATREQVSGAPEVGADGHISAAEEAGIYRYYGFGDDTMTRSEEHLVAGTRTVETGRVRLRKYVVTEMATVEVPVRREEVRLEHEPITDAERDAAYAGGSVTDITEITEITDATDSEREIILHAERPVVTTETVAVERVRLGKETVTGTETVSGRARREEIELED